MKVEGTIKPREIEVTETVVFINTNITEVKKTFEDEENIFYEWEQEAHSKNEYIQLLHSRTSMLEDALQDLIIDLEG